MHRTLEDHVKKFCSNDSCHKSRNGEPLKSFFEGTHHYVGWECNECGNLSWWKTDHFSSGIHHMRL